MTVLTKGMYGNEFKPVKGRFGLHCGQTRRSEWFHNAGWYNIEGEKIGWGDLAELDLKIISDGLETGEVFIILREVASFWKFVKQYGCVGSLCGVSPDMESPGLDYCIENAACVIKPGNVTHICDVSEYGMNRDQLTKEWLLS